MGMICKGDYAIEIMMQDCFGKRPGLYVGYGNCLTKVGNFASEEKAERFEEYLLHFCGIAEKPKEDA